MCLKSMDTVQLEKLVLNYRTWNFRWLTFVVLITGPSSSGIGSQVAASIATAKPETIILAGRNETRIQPVAAEIRRCNPEVSVKIVPLDLLSNRSIRYAVQEIGKITSNIDILINNAGVMATRTFMYSEDGVESQFASNYLGHFLFTNLLIKEKIVKSGDIIVNVGSLGYQMADIQFNDINFKVRLPAIFTLSH